jgi:hypothetical protein
MRARVIRQPGQPLSASSLGSGGRARAPIYFVLLRFGGGRVTHIRDYRHARYAVELLQVEPLNIAR